MNDEEDDDDDLVFLGEERNLDVSLFLVAMEQADREVAEEAERVAAEPREATIPEG